MATDLLDMPIEDVDVSDPELFSQDVASPVFARLRREAPVHYCKDSAYGPYWSLTKYDDIIKCDTNHKVFSSQGSIILDEVFLEGGVGDDVVPIAGFIATDPPYHDEQRRAVTPVVSPANLARFEKVIRDKAGSILDSLSDGEEFDWVETVSIDLTNYMLATMLDFPFEERHRLTRWSDFMAGTPGDGLVTSWDEKNAVLRECAEWITALRNERATQEPKLDLISIMAHAPAVQNCSPEQFIGTVILLIVGGNDTTRNTISGSVIGLNNSPDEFRKLVASPDLVTSFVPEAVRWQTPLIHQARRALDDAEIGGKQIRKGDKVVMWYYSGNRDEDVIPDGEKLIVDRPNPRQHLSFGFGLHRCMGNRLAELQLRVLWEEVLKRAKWIEQTGPAVRQKSNFNRSISSLPVRIHR